MTYDCLSPGIRSDQVEGLARLTDREFNTTKKSVTSAPACPPTPSPAVPIALGADHAMENKLKHTGRNGDHTHSRRLVWQ
jgi:hypothetical protein